MHRHFKSQYLCTHGSLGSYLLNCCTCQSWRTPDLAWPRLWPIFKITVLRNMRVNSPHDDIQQTQSEKIQPTFSYGIGLSNFVSTVMVLLHCDGKAAFQQ